MHLLLSSFRLRPAQSPRAMPGLRTAVAQGNYPQRTRRPTPPRPEDRHGARSRPDWDNIRGGLAWHATSPRGAPSWVFAASGNS